MGFYGSGITFKRACELDREQIVHALHQEIISGEDENGFYYEACSKEEADQRVLAIFDNLVFQARDSQAFHRAVEKYLHKKLGKKWMRRFVMKLFRSGLIEEEKRKEFADDFNETEEDDGEDYEKDY